MTERPRNQLPESDPRIESLLAKLSTLIAAARTADIQMPNEVPGPFTGLTEDERRVLYLLQDRSNRRLQALTATAPGALASSRVTDSKTPEESATEAARGGPEFSQTSYLDNASTQADGISDGGHGDVDSARPDMVEKNQPETEQSVDSDAEGPIEAMVPCGIPKVSGLGRTSPPRPIEIRLANGRVRQAYAATTDRPVLSVHDDGGSGLSRAPDGGLAGTPEVAGEFLLTLDIADPDGKPRPAQARLTVIADPRDLWTSMPSDKTALHWKPDEVVMTAEGDAFMVAASLRGRSHARKGGFREDDCAVQAEKGGWHFLAVADGAGSAQLSREGSRLACAAAMTSLSNSVNTQLDTNLMARLTSWQTDPDREMASIRRDLLYPVLAGAAHDAMKAILTASEAAGTEASAYSTTLHCAIARKIDLGWFIASFSVGDGGTVVFDGAGGTAEMLCKPDGGEFAGQTVFLSPSIFDDPQAVIDRVHCTIRPSFTALALMTDGITDPFFSYRRGAGRPGCLAEVLG